MSKRLEQLNEQRSSLFGQIKKRAEEFKANGEKFKDAADKAAWDQANTEYDSVIMAIEEINGVSSRMRQFRAPLNPKNIGLDDAGGGRVGGLRAPGHEGEYDELIGREYVLDSRGRHQKVLRPADSYAAELCRINPELAGQYPELDLGSYLRAMVAGPKTAVERNALMESGGSGGGWTVPTFLAAQLIDLLRSKSRIIEAGAQTIRLESEEQSFAYLASEPTPQWLGEGASMTEKDATFGKINFRACTLRMLVKASRELLEDSVNINAKLPGILAGSTARELDRVALLGLGVGNGDGTEPLGVLNYPGINTVSMGDNGAALADYDPVLDAVEKIETANAVSPTAAIMHPRTWRAAAGLADTTGQPLMRPEAIRDMRFFTTTKVPITQTQGTAAGICSSVVIGGFSETVIAMRSDVQIELLRERYADTFQYGFLVHLRADCGAFHEQAFAKIIGIKP